MCNFLGSVSQRQKCEVVDQCCSSFTAQFYLASKGKYIVKAWGQVHQKRERASFWLLFPYAVFSSPSLPCVSRASQEGCLFHLRLSFQSSDLPLFYFGGLSPLSFSHLYIGLLFSYSNYLALLQTGVELQGPTQSLLALGGRQGSPYCLGGTEVPVSYPAFSPTSPVGGRGTFLQALENTSLSSPTTTFLWRLVRIERLLSKLSVLLGLLFLVCLVEKTDFCSRPFIYACWHSQLPARV